MIYRFPPPAIHDALMVGAWRWFNCRYCGGLFIIGRTSNVTAHAEAKTAIEHENKCRKEYVG